MGCQVRSATGFDDVSRIKAACNDTSFPDDYALVSQNGNAYEEGLGNAWGPIREYRDVPTAENRMEQRTKSGLCKLLLGKGLVGAWRFELQTSCAQGRRATRLRYAPITEMLAHATRAAQTVLSFE